MLQATDSEGWEFLHALGNCSSLTAFSLSYNNLQGAIPNSIGNLSISLTRLLMFENNLSGIVPPSIGKLSALVQLSLDHNNFTGTIKEWLGNMTKLERLNLQSNSFIGTIPPSIGRLTRLTYFYLAKNQFTGFVPPSMGNLKTMLTLNLSYNNLQGSLPVEFGNFKQLTTLDLSFNIFSGKIPETMGQFEQIYTIQLDANILIGSIPITFSNLKSLSILNLSHNNLSGSIPVYLNDLKSLTKLDLSYNNFHGEIPENGVFDNATIVSLDGNLGLCGGATNLHMPSCHVVYRREEKIINYMVKILVPVFGSILLILFIYIRIHEKKTPRIYKGKLTQAKIEVAIKNEALRTIRHRNLLPVLTACSTIDNSGNDFKSLIYEFMPNGNLDTWLHQRHGAAPKFLDLAQRISVGVDVADVLAYLHHDCGMPIVHCDLKPTNILLDDDMNAYLGDFGIANLIVDSRSVAVGHSGCTTSLTVTGTIGYIAPEYGQSVHASTCGDVYSFGIVLLEMITGKRPTDSVFEGDLNIANFVERNFPDQVLHTIDAHLPEECKGSNKAIMATENRAYRCVLSLVQVALACTLRLPRERMSMREVAINLHAIRKSYVTTIK
ncbi:hypothetical protein BDA96_03G192600 [Sorghum bicolor]|uniref:non-specific serine/threonine protein kinase n=1 Tax=Sorghum bicolor TaxID=4558 RepID=A0A921RD09_SORBI|nr:hypothetical protein BDA96_03G192600 [Sorghum bicolor]